MGEIKNDRFRLGWDDKTGRIVSFYDSELDREFIQEPRLGESFRLLVPLKDRRCHYIYGSEQSLSSSSINGNTLKLTWHNVKGQTGMLTIPISVTQNWELREDEVAVSTTIDNRSQLEITEVWGGIIGGLAGSEGDENTSVITNDGSGRGNKWRKAFQTFPGSYLGPEFPWIRDIYGSSSAMGFFMFCDMKNSDGLYIGYHDPTPRAVFYVFQIFPDMVTDGFGKRWPRHEELGDADTPIGMTCGWVNIPAVKSAQKFTTGETVFKPFTGSWHIGIKRWRDFMAPYLNLDRPKTWLMEKDAWQSIVMNFPENSIGFRYRDLPDVARAGREIGIDVLHIIGWDIAGLDAAFPDHSIDPRLGNEEDLKEAIQMMRAEGTHALMFANLSVANIETEWFMNELKHYTYKQQGGGDCLVGWGYTTLIDNYYPQTHMAYMSLADPRWRKVMLEQLKRIIDLGADGLQLDKTGCTANVIFHGPGSDEPDTSSAKGSLELLEQILEYGRGKDPAFCIAAESHYDRLLGLIDAAFNRVDAAEHIPFVRYIFPEYRQTVCIPGSADYNLVNLGIRYGYIINVEPMRYSKDVRAVADLAVYIKQALDLRRNLKSLLWDGEYCDTMGFSIDSEDQIFGALFKNESQQAIVLQHYSGKEKEAVVTFEYSDANNYTIHRPGKPSELIASGEPVLIPKSGLAVVVAK